MKISSIQALILVLVAALLLGGCSSDKADASGLEWNEYWPGMNLAQETDKNIIINFYADWCSYCKKMDSETFTDRRVVEYLKNNFVLIKVNADKSKDIAQAYMARSLPTTWFLKSDGEKIAPLPGYFPPDNFLIVAKYIGSGSYETVKFDEYVEKEMYKSH